MSDLQGEIAFKQMLSTMLLYFLPWNTLRPVTSRHKIDLAGGAEQS